MQKLDGKSLDIVSENVEKLKEIFPEVFSEGKIDFEKLENELGEFVEKEKERYNFTWAGKQNAKKIAQSPSTGTLRPAKEESKNWDSTQNLYIEGDNLEVLKLLQKSYHKQVKMIYIDPPYNTGKDFVYKDNFKDNIKNYLELTVQVDSEGNRLSTNAETNGRYHSDWLSMMYPRLKLARNLLKDDGVIVIHIDESEYDNLYFICKEIFGETNDIGTIIWDKGNPKGDSKTIAVQNEFIIVFAKNIEKFIEVNQLKRAKKNAKKMINKALQLYKKIGKKVLPDDIKNCIKYYNLDIDTDDIKQVYDLNAVNAEFQKWLNKQDFTNGEKAYKYIDENGRVYRGVSMAWPNKKKAPDEYFIPLIHPVTNLPCPVPEKGWRNPPETMKQLLDKNLILFGEDENKQPERKYLLEENMEENIPSVLFFGGSDEPLFKEIGLTFDNPKPYKFAKELVSYFIKDGDLILDFFSGSATTAHAVIQLNAEDGGNRKYIMVQLPEPTDKKSEAFKAGYKNICEIGKERIRRAGEKINDEFLMMNDELNKKDNSKLNIQHSKLDLDIGFKVFKLDSSNIKEWDSDFDNLEKNLLESIDNIKEDRSSEDLLYEILLKYGLDLTLPIEEKQMDNKKVFVIGYGALVVCLDEDITIEIVEQIAKLKQEYQTEVMRVVFRDSSFKDAVVKTNALEVLKQFGIDEVVSV